MAQQSTVCLKQDGKSALLGYNGGNMEQVWLVAKTSFVNRWIGSVNKKQRFLCAANVAEEFVSMGIADYEQSGEKVTVTEAELKKSSPSPIAETDGEEEQSVLLPVETVLPTRKSRRQRKIESGDSLQ